MKSKIIILPIIFLTGCSGLINYKTEVYIDGKKKAEVRGNVPSKAKIGDIEIDQRGQSWWEKMGEFMPKNIKIEQ
ncbi:hypothetical protein J7K25_00835 [bacterium]|nr:hypothetical protein [bacterium]